MENQEKNALDMQKIPTIILISICGILLILKLLKINLFMPIGKILNKLSGDNYIIQFFIIIALGLILQLPSAIRAFRKYKEYSISNPNEYNIHTFLLINRLKSFIGTIILAFIFLFVKNKFY